MKWIDALYHIILFLTNIMNNKKIGEFLLTKQMAHDRSSNVTT